MSSLQRFISPSAFSCRATARCWSASSTKAGGGCNRQAPYGTESGRVEGLGCCSPVLKLSPLIPGKGIREISIAAWQLKTQIRYSVAVWRGSRGRWRWHRRDLRVLIYGAARWIHLGFDTLEGVI